MMGTPRKEQIKQHLLQVGHSFLEKWLSSEIAYVNGTKGRTESGLVLFACINENFYDDKK